MVIILCNIADFSRTSRTYYIIIASVTAHLRKQVLTISDFITSTQMAFLRVPTHCFIILEEYAGAYLP